MSPRVVVSTLLMWGFVCAAIVSADTREALQQAARLVQQGRLDDAERQIRVALADAATDADARAVAYSMLGTIRFQQQRFDDSATFLRKAITLQPRLLGAHLTLAEVYAQQNKAAEALAMCRRALDLDRPNAIARLGQSPRAITFGLLLAKDGRAAEAIDVLERAKQIGPVTYELAFDLGGAYLLNKDAARALDAYDLALTLTPETRESMAALRQAAALAEEQGQLERSLAYWIRAKKIAPDDSEILLGFGRVCLRLDLLEDAEPALTKAAHAKPRDLAYQYTLAAAKVGKKQFDAAQALLEPLVAAQPKDAQLQYALGSVFYIQGRLTEAAAHLQESVRLQPGQLASHYYLALIARDQGRDAEAIGMLERLLQRYPDHAPSCEALGGLLMSAQRYEDAERHLRNAVRLNPTAVKPTYQLGLLLARMGKKDEADTQLARAKTLRQEDEATSRLQLRLLESVP